MVTRLTEHAKRRLSDRLADLITADEVATKVASQTALPMGRRKSVV